MASKNMDIIEKLKQEAIDRCRKRIEQAAKDKVKTRPETRNNYGLTSAFKRQYGL